MPHHRRRLLIVASLALVASLGAACDDGLAPLPREGAPAELHFTIAGFGAGTATLELVHDTLVLVRRGPEAAPGDPGDSARVVPTAAAWRAFWEAADRNGVGRWQREYVAEDVVDGVGWTLRLGADDGVHVTSSGFNSYPDGMGREHEVESTAEFRAFVEALGALIGQRVFY